MWKRIEYLEWQTLLPQIGFALFALAFAIIIWRTFRIKKQDLDKASNMPLEND